MPNMMDYLAWRGDIALDYAPFNDVDSLILASLSYLTYPVEEGLLRDLALTVAPVDRNQFSFVHEIRAMLSAAALTERFAGIRMQHPVAVTDEDRDMQFAAVTFSLPDSSHYVAFRGTDSSIVGWHEDFNMAFESPIPAQLAAVDYLKADTAKAATWPSMRPPTQRRMCRTASAWCIPSTAPAWTTPPWPPTAMRPSPGASAPSCPSRASSAF